MMLEVDCTACMPLLGPYDNLFVQFFYTGLVAALATPWILVSFSQVWLSSTCMQQSLLPPDPK